MDIPEQNIEEVMNLSNSRRHEGPAEVPSSVNHEVVGVVGDTAFSPVEAKKTKACPRSWWIIGLAAVAFFTLMGLVVGVIHNKSNNGTPRVACSTA